MLLPNNSLEHGAPRVINFNLDYTKIYIGTVGGRNGKIYVADVDANLDIVSPPAVFATGIGTGGFHDTLGIDLCGYLYVADYNASSMYRISPQGQVQLLLESSNFLAREHGRGMEWGSGDYGWDDHAVYITQPYNGNTLTEVVIGVPSRHWIGGVAINVP